MTPPDTGCPASSEPSGGSSGAGARRGTRASRGEGRATGPKWPLIAHYTLNRERWDEGPFLSCRGLEGDGVLFRKALYVRAQPWFGRKGLDESEVPAKTSFLVLT